MRESRKRAVERLERDNAALRESLERAQAEIEQYRLQDVPSDLGYLFIVTYGRTGSTLLQGILNAIPGYLIRGENRAMPYRLYRYHRASEVVRQDLARPHALPPTHPFFGIDGYRDDLAFRDMRKLMLDTILRPEPDTRVTGFKEIRWNQKDVRRYARFLAKVFPEARFVVNTRDHAAVGQSKWWARNPDVESELQQREDYVFAVKEDMGDRAFHVHYDDYVEDPDRLRELFAWLGEEFDRRRIDDVLARRHSY